MCLVLQEKKGRNDAKKFDIKIVAVNDKFWENKRENTTEPKNYLLTIN